MFQYKQKSLQEKLPETGIAMLDMANGHMIPYYIRQLLLSYSDPKKGEKLDVKKLYPRLTGTKRECFRNASLGADAYDDLSYVEGYVLQANI